MASRAHWQLPHLRSFRLTSSDDSPITCLPLISAPGVKELQLVGYSGWLEGEHADVAAFLLRHRPHEWEFIKDWPFCTSWCDLPNEWSRVGEGMSSVAQLLHQLHQGGMPKLMLAEAHIHQKALKDVVLLLPASTTSCDIRLFLSCHRYSLESVCICMDDSVKQTRQQRVSSTTEAMPRLHQLRLRTSYPDEVLSGFSFPTLHALSLRGVGSSLLSSFELVPEHCPALLSLFLWCRSHAVKSSRAVGGIAFFGSYDYKINEEWHIDGPPSLSRLMTLFPDTRDLSIRFAEPPFIEDLLRFAESGKLSKLSSLYVPEIGSANQRLMRALRYRTVNLCVTRSDCLISISSREVSLFDRVQSDKF